MSTRRRRIPRWLVTALELAVLVVTSGCMLGLAALLFIKAPSFQTGLSLLACGMCAYACAHLASWIPSGGSR